MGGIGRLAAAPLVGSYRVASGAAKGAIATTMAQPMNQVASGVGGGAMSVAAQSMNYLSGNKSETDAKGTSDIVQSNKDASSKPEVAQSNKILGAVVKALEGIHAAIGQIEQSTRMTAMATHDMLNTMKKGPKDPYQKARERLQANPILKPMELFKDDDKPDEEGKKKRGGIMGFFGSMASGIASIASWFISNWKLVLGVMGLTAIGALLITAFKDEIRDYLEKKGIIKEDESIFGGVASFVNEYIKKKLDESPFFSWMITEGTDDEGNKTREWSMKALLAGLAGLALFVAPFALPIVAGLKIAAWGALITGIVVGMTKLNEWLGNKMTELGLEEEDAEEIANDAVNTAAAVSVASGVVNKITGNRSPTNPNTNKLKVDKANKNIPKRDTRSIIDKALNPDGQKGQFRASRLKQIYDKYPRIQWLMKNVKAFPKVGAPIAALMAAPEVISVLGNDDMSKKEKAKNLADEFGGVLGSILSLMAVASLSGGPPGWLIGGLATGAGYLAGSFGMKMLANWLLGGDPKEPEIPVGEHGYPVNEEMVMMSNRAVTGSATPKMMPNPDYDPAYSADVQGAAIVDQITAPSDAIQLSDAEAAAIQIVNQTFNNQSSNASQNDNSVNVGGGGGLSGNAPGGRHKNLHMPFNSALVPG